QLNTGQLQWTGASHPMGVSGYQLLANGVEPATLPTTQLSDAIPGLVPGTDYFFQIQATDAQGNESNDGPSLLLTTQAATLPPTLKLNGTVATTLPNLATGLYTGPDAPQKGVDPATIKVERATVVRGHVRDRGGNSVPNINITILDNPELGTTTTAATGTYHN